MKCQSYNPNGQICKDGFIQKLICWGNAQCFGCGRYSEASLPNCMNEDPPAHFINDDGTTRFYRRDGGAES